MELKIVMATRRSLELRQKKTRIYSAISWSPITADPLLRKD
jgi:hypothetical protein